MLHTALIARYRSSSGTNERPDKSQTGTPRGRSPTRNRTSHGFYCLRSAGKGVKEAVRLPSIFRMGSTGSKPAAGLRCGASLVPITTTRPRRRSPTVSDADCRNGYHDAGAQGAHHRPDRGIGRSGRAGVRRRRCQRKPASAWTNCAG